MRYKHIPTGDIVAEVEGKSGYYRNIWIPDGQLIAGKYIVGCKDWQEIKEPEYTILIYGSRKMSNNNLYDRINDNTYKLRGSELKYNLSDFKDCPIISLQRNSDKQIFTVGDKYSNSSGIFTIERFELQNEMIIVHAVEAGAGSLNYISKVKPKDWEIFSVNLKRFPIDIITWEECKNDGRTYDEWVNYHLAQEPKSAIQAVKYLPTGEIFQIGSETNKGKVIKIETFGTAPNQDIRIHAESSPNQKGAYTLGKAIKLQPKKEYEIISFRRNYDNKIVYVVSKEMCQASLEDNNAHIYSVKCVKDNQIFTIGDVVEFGKTTNTIKEFYINAKTEHYKSTLFAIIDPSMSEHDEISIGNLKKAPKKEWEITAFRLKEHNKYSDGIYKPLGGKYNVGFFTYSEKEVLESKNYEIYSVRSLSDNVEFKLGDTIKEVLSNNPQKTWKITAFHIESEIVEVQELNVNHGSYTTLHFRNIKLYKEKLFTTEDGVDIFEGDKYVMLDVANWYIDETGGKGLNEKDYRIFFASKEKAEEYILLNKPCLSINDILKIGFVEKQDLPKLKELVKSKI